MYFPQLSTREIPQADTLENITDVVQFVSKGYTTYQMIAKKLGLVERQGRYYRLAAELLGFIRNIPHKNIARLTSLGKEFLVSNNDEKRQILFAQIFRVPVVQSVIGVLAASNGSALQEEISNVLFEIVTDSTKTMMKRRLQTILSWLGTLGVITKSGSVIRLVNIPNSVDKIEIKDIRMPVLPRIDDPKLFKNVFSAVLANRDTIRIAIKRANIERTNDKHEILRDMLAQRIRTCGVIATFNSYIDLAVRINNASFIAEAKIVDLNLESQIRNSISQLREYKNLQSSPNAKLILLFDKAVSERDYELINDLQKEEIYFIWNDEDSRLRTTPEGFEALPFMSR